MVRKAVAPYPAARVLSRRDLLRAGGILVPAAFAVPSFFARTARAQTAAPFDYYISTTGSDGNPGTLAQPWAITSLQAANGNNSRMRGKRIGLLPGTYNIVNLPQPGDYQHPILRPPPGSATATTYLASSDASGNYLARTATIQWGGSGSSPALGPNCDDPGYLVIDGLIVDAGGYSTSNGNSPQGTISFSSNGGGSPSSAGNIQGCGVQNCEVRNMGATPYGNNQALIFASGYSGFFVKNCILHNCHKPSQPDHCHGYQEYTNQNSRITNNTIYDCDTGVHAKEGCSGTTFAYNYIYNCQVAAIQGVDGATGNPNTPGAPYSVHHNIIDGCGSTHACDVNGQAYQGLSWYNNTIYNHQGGAVNGLDLRAARSNLIQCYNNIVVCTANGSGPYYGTVAVSPGGFAVLDYNCYELASYSAGWGLNGASGGNTTYNSLAAWQSASRADANSIVGSPTFAAAITSGAGPAQFKLSANSPCNGRGRVGGVSSGAACNLGAWDGTVTQIGASATSATSPPPAAVPDAPTLTVS